MSVIDVTNLFREILIRFNKKNGYIFNNSIINVSGPYFLMAARIHVPIAHGNMQHMDIPVMWGTVKNSRITISEGWNGIKDYTLLLLCKMTFEKCHIRSYDYVGSFAFEVGESSPIIANEDPRLYRKADGQIYMYTVGMDMLCQIPGAKVGSKCAYITEWKIGVNLNTGNVGCLRQCTRTVPCKYGVLNREKDLKAMKNWSPWVYESKDYWSDFFPQYMIYASVGNEACRKIKNQPSPVVYIKEMEKYNSFLFNTIGNIKLFKFTSTTPSVALPEYLRQKMFPNHTTVMVGVAHVRMTAKVLIKNQKYFDALTTAANIEPEYYESLKMFIAQIKTWHDNDLIFMHPDIYAMCMYFFDPDVKNGHTGNIIATTDVFIPMAFNKDKSLASRFALTFPVGLVFGPDCALITYGEGDVKTRMLAIDDIPTELGLIPYTKDFATNLKYRIVERTINGWGNYEEKRSVSQMVETI